MPRKMEAPLRVRKAEELAHEREIARVFAERNKSLETVRRENKQKKKSTADLIALLNITDIEGAAVKDAWSYVPRSRNLQRQMFGLINHLFVQYPVPEFLYQACLKGSDDPLKRRHPQYRQWLLALAQGRSFTKMVKGILSAKEAFVFLAAPSGNRIHQNIWWARMKVAGLPDRMAADLLDTLFDCRDFEDADGKLADVIRFYARYHEQMSRVTFTDITDFISWKLRQEPDFSMKGRTIGSVINLANEWHKLIQKAKLGHNVRWDGMGLPDWEFEAKDRIWKMTELKTNKDLMEEGRKQKHCVYSYVHWCASGRSAIFSLRAYRKTVGGYSIEGLPIWLCDTEFEGRVTVEVHRQQTAVVQVRGLLNSKPSDDAREILRRWTGDHGLLYRGS